MVREIFHRDVCGALCARLNRWGRYGMIGVIYVLRTLFYAVVLLEEREHASGLNRPD